MTYQEVFEKSKEIIMQYDAGKLEGHLAVDVRIEGEGEGIFYIELLDGKVYVEPYEYIDRDCRFVVSAEDFLRIADGSLDPVFAYTTGKLKVEGSIDKALEFRDLVNTAKKKGKKK